MLSNYYTNYVLSRTSTIPVPRRGPANKINNKKQRPVITKTMDGMTDDLPWFDKLTRA